MKTIISGYGDNEISLSLYDIDLNTEKFKVLDSVILNQPSFVTSCKEGKRTFVYTYTKNPLALVSYEICNNKLVLIDKINIPGSTLTHLFYDTSIKRLYGCSYANGSYMYINVCEGKFGNYKYIEKTKPALCHCVFENSDSNEINIVDIKNDSIVAYDKDLNYKRTYQLPKGVGPRHAIYNKKRIYVITEYSNEIYVFDSEKNIIIQNISTLNSDLLSNGATLLIVNDFLYASNRGEDTIARFAIKEKLEYVSSFSCFGNHPRHMVAYNDKYLISCNKDSSNVSIIELNKNKEILEFPFYQVSGISIVE